MERLKTFFGISVVFDDLAFDSSVKIVLRSGYMGKATAHR